MWQQFPLQAFNLSPVPQFGVRASFWRLHQLNSKPILKQQTLAGSFAVDKPGLQQIQANRLTGDISYREGGC